jgi:hypothetical protein
VTRKRTARQPKAPPRKAGGALVLRAQELDALREQLEASVESATEPGRWNVDPTDVKRSVARLVLTLVEFVRRLLERQAIRRMEEHTLTPEETEAIGQALMRLEETILELAARFELDPGELNLELGPLGRLI